MTYGTVIAMFGRRRARAEVPSVPPLRDNALTGPLPPRPSDAPGRATLAMMELAAGGGVATVCSYVDGTTSLYLNTGGGVIGVGQDERAAAASRAFVAAVEAAQGSLALANLSSELDRGKVRFLLRVEDRVLGAECAETAVQRADHPLHQGWRLGQDVLTWTRVISEERARNE